MLAAWHPLLASSGGGANSGLVVATTAEGPWAARPRSEAISVVASIAAKVPLHLGLRLGLGLGLGLGLALGLG